MGKKISKEKENKIMNISQKNENYIIYITII